ncbi:MAG: 4Fe-4S binding protein [Planctomycetes bacterium]|nr:4Fe-4S binding protein [Planctomycetota bacterium]
MARISLKKILSLSFLFLPMLLWAEPQDPPDFTTHMLPADDRPEAAAPLFAIVDMAMLFFALSLTTFFVYKTRSRKSIFVLSLFSLGYFGFYRLGCVCPIGSIQNISQALFDPNYIAPLVVIVYFALPLAFSAIFGRSYCASVCPHGALQDAVLMKPIEVPMWLDHALGLLPFVYLGLGILFAATGSAYIICDYDPFIAIFRLTGSANMLGMGALFLLAGMFIGRPYCRYMCPYGVLLRMFSSVAKWNVEIYPDRCIDCSLCDNSCPFNAIIKTTPEHQVIKAKDGKKQLSFLLFLAPFIVIGLGYLSSLAAPTLARGNEVVRMAYQIEQEELALSSGQSLSEVSRPEESEVWRDRFDDAPALFAEAQQIIHQFVVGSWILGLFIGLVILFKLYKLSVHRVRHQYVADYGSCYSCGRCYDYCPGSNGLPDQAVTGGHLR